MSTGTVRQFPIYAEDETGYGGAAATQPIENGEGVNATVLNRPTGNLRNRTETVRGVLEDLLYLADADRVLMLAGPGTVSWPGSVTAGATGVFTLSDALFLLPALTPGFAQTSPVPPVASSFGSLAINRNSDSMPSIGVTSLIRGYTGGDKLNVTVVLGSAYSCVLADETTMSIVLTVTPTTQLSTVITSLDALLNANGDNIVNAALINGALGTDVVQQLATQYYMALGYDAEGHTITPAQLAAFFAADPNNALAEGDSLCIQYATMIDESPMTEGGRRQSLAENSNTSVLSTMLFNSSQNVDRLPNAIPVCKVINGRLVFIGGQQVPAGATGFDLGSGYAAIATADIMRSCIASPSANNFDEAAHAGLTFNALDGVYWMNGQRVVKAADGVLLTDAATNYVYVDTDGDLKATTVLSTAAFLPRLLLYRVVTAGGAITTVTDLRRYLSKYNSRAFVTVNASFGDFATLESAVTWVTLMRSVGEDTTLEIVVQGDVTMTSQIVFTAGMTIRANDQASGHINTPSGAIAFSVQTGTVSDVIFKGLTFNVPTTAGSGLIDVGGDAVCANWQLVDCTVTGGRDVHLIDVRSSAPQVGWKIRHCEFSGMAHTSGYLCILLEQMSDAVISGNRITGGTGDIFDAGIAVMYDSRGNIIENNRIHTGGIAIIVLDDNFASTLTAVSEGNRVSKNRISGTNGTNAFQICGTTVCEENFFDGCDPGTATNGVVSVWGGGGGIVFSNNLVLDWPQGAAVEFNTEVHGSVITGNVFRSTLETADLGLHDVNAGLFGPVVITGNLFDFSGQAVPGGSPSAIAIDMGDRSSAVVCGNVFRGVGSAGFLSTGVVTVGAGASIIGNTFNYCTGEPYAVGTTPVIMGNRDAGGSTDPNVLRFDNPGRVVHNGFQRAESLANSTTAEISLNDNCSTLYVQCPLGALHVIGGFSNPFKGRRIEIWNTGTNAITIGHEEGTIATAANRNHCSGTNDITLPAKGCAIATYDDDISRWRCAIVG